MGLCVCALLVSCGRTQWREADARLFAATQAARTQGYVPLSGPHNTFGDFASAGSVAWRTHLDEHTTYFVAAACTEGCDTLDFVIAEPQGHELSADTSAGPAPRLMFTTPEEGDYRVTFRFGHCRTERCRWVAQVYAKTTAQSPQSQQ
jgi:hypothetical protein